MLDYGNQVHNDHIYKAYNGSMEENKFANDDTSPYDATIF